MRRWPHTFRLRLLIILLFAAAALAVAVFAIKQGGDIANMGYLIVGALIAAGSLLLNDWLNAPKQAIDLSVVLHAEISNRAARCCFDFETWRAYLEPPLKKRNSFDVAKFCPVAPVIYPATASQLAILNTQTTRHIIEFYFRLAACERDFPNVADKIERRDATKGELELLCSRLERTLQPALDALTSLGGMVSDAEKMENGALDSYDRGRNPQPTEKSLRQRIRNALASRPSV